MQAVLKPLPISIQSFARLREKGCLYVDKTADIHRLVTTSEAVFLSRPRRFGKSLLLSTLEELFKGSEPLFRGLAIHDKWDWTQKHPVIRIDWTRYGSSLVDELRILVGDHLQTIAKEYDVTLSQQLVDHRLAELIFEIHKKTGQQVVVMVDEYDKLLLDALDNEDRFAAAQDFLRSVYVVFKAMSEHIRFVFLTGVSKFAGVSVFSGLNNLYDITFDQQYATICGYTQTELEENFAEYIEATSAKLKYEKATFLSVMKDCYNGYSWDAETSVYNPFSILLLFANQRFGNFWFNTATPLFLIKLLRDDTKFRTIVDSEKTCFLETTTGNPRKPDILSLLFQTGYLTIRGFDDVSPTKRKYTLDFPNTEVRDSFLTSLLNDYLSEDSDGADDQIETMKADLRAGDVVAFEKHLRTLLAGIPYLLTGKDTESHYHVMTLLWLRLLGFKIQGEVMTDKGRIDAVWELPNQVIIIEIKLSHVTAAATDTTIAAAEKEKLLDSAFVQMKTKGYADAYMNTSKKISLLALAFFNKDVACRLEVLKEK